MPEYHITTRANALEDFKTLRATHFVSICSPGSKPLKPMSLLLKPNRRLALTFWDTDDQDDPGAPTAAHIQQLLKFGRRLPESAIVLLHCDEGKSRSPAAMIALARSNAKRWPEQALSVVEEVKENPFLRPNTLMLALLNRVIAA